MIKPSVRLTELTAYEVVQIQRRAENLARLDHFLSHLPLGLQAEYLSDEGFNHLRRIAREPERELSGSFLLRWHNKQRTPIGLAHHDIE